MQKSTIFGEKKLGGQNFDPPKKIRFFFRICAFLALSCNSRGADMLVGVYGRTPPGGPHGPLVGLVLHAVLEGGGRAGSAGPKIFSVEILLVTNSRGRRPCENFFFDFWAKNSTQTPKKQHKTPFLHDRCHFCMWGNCLHSL